mgnify:CR=1 FL=1
MNTGPIKNFAQDLRNQLRDGVKQRLLYWGFNEKGEVIEKPESVEGGYLFRGKVFSDETVPHRWKQLKKMIQIHDVDYVIEEGAYTWFNRLMAIRILEKNNYIQPQLEYEEGTNLPYLLQNARRGIFPDMQDKELEELKKQLRENKDNEVFARLLTHFCDSNTLISNVFGKISYREDYTELLLPHNLLDKEGILDFIVTTDAITDEDFEQVELIGWLYQYYISEKKDEVFKSFKKRKKAGPEELPAATQIFTPEWIVRYMVENTVGRLWMDLHPDSDLIERMGYYVEPSDENPNAEPIIEDITDLTLLDPAAGSGHILVVGFEYLMEMYREEGYTARQSVENILRNNLYGLEIDERAAQLARFAVLLKAAKYDKSVLDGKEQPQIHSFPEQTDISTAELREFLGEEGEEYVNEYRDALDILQYGKNYGSTIQLDISGKAIDFAKKRVNDLGSEAIENLATQQLLHKLNPFIKVIALLKKDFKAVAANPPYMGSRNMNGQLKEYLKDHYPDSKKDLFAVFIEAMIDFLQSSGYLSCITMEAWMFLSSYQSLREKIIQNYCINSLTHFGWHVIGIAFGTAMMNLKKRKPKHQIGEYSYLEIEDIDEKNNTPYSYPIKDNGRYSLKEQSEFLKIPGSPIAYWVDEKIIKIFQNYELLDSHIHAFQGMITGDNSYYLRYWFEVSEKSLAINYDEIEQIQSKKKKWVPYNKGGSSCRWYGNHDYVIRWEDGGNELTRNRSNNSDFYLAPGITWTFISSSRFSVRYFPQGFLWDVSGSSAFPYDENLLPIILGFLNTKLAKKFLDIVNPTFNYQVENILQLPFKVPDDLTQKNITHLVNSALDIAKRDWNRSELSWKFDQHKLLNFESTSITESISELKKVDLNDFVELVSIEKKINEIFIDFYGLQDNLDSNVKPNKVTLLKDVLSNSKLKKISNNDINIAELDSAYEEDKIIKSFISYSIGCLMGRYQLEEEGLYIASPNLSMELTYEVSYPLLNDQKSKTEKFEIDDDGLIPLVGSDGPFSDDITYRMKNMIRLIWGEQNLTENLNYIQKKLDQELEQYLTEKFWMYHVKLYSKSPIYWLFSSKNGAFKILAYMHRMDKYTVQKVRQNYLHTYMDYLRKEIEKLDKTGTLNSNESKHMDQLRSDLNECLEYDEVLKEVADKQIDFDLDDGVDHNYELFGKALAKI